MKNTKSAATTIWRLMFWYDATHHRVDITASVMGAATLAILIAYALTTGASAVSVTLVLLWAAVAAILFGLQRLFRYSNISYVITFLAVMLVMGGASVRSVSALLAAMAALTVTIFFLARPEKELLIPLGATVGLLGGFMDADAGVSIVVVVTILVVMRIGWRLFIERLSKRGIIMLTAKTMVFLVAMGAVYATLLASQSNDGLMPAYDSPLPSVSMPVLLVLTVLGVRGIVASLLITTPRSPLRRGLRLYVMFIVGLLLLLGWLVTMGGSIIFNEAFLGSLATAGFGAVSVGWVSLVVIALVLIVAAGVDRSLFHTTAFGAALRKRLGAALVFQREA